MTGCAMIKNRYVLRSTRFTGEITLGFDKGGVLREMTNVADLNDIQFRYLLATLPFQEADLPRLIGDSQTLTVTQLAPDLSFEVFIKRYGKRVGNKARQVRLWNELSDVDKQLALDTITAYDYYLMCNPTIVKLYAETYLHQRRFETDYRAEVNQKKR